MSRGWGGGPHGGEATRGQYLAAILGLAAILAVFALVLFWRN